MANLLRRFPFFLLLLPLFVVIHIERDIPGLIEYRFIYDHLIAMFLAPALFFLLFYLITRSWRKAAIQTFISLLFFYFFGEIKNAISKSASDLFLQSYLLLVPVSAILMLFLFYRVNKSRNDFAKLYFFINTALLFFIAADLVILFSNKRKINQISNLAENHYTPCDGCSKPDIYYIIFDSYTSSSMLKQDFNYSNHAIENSLKQKGFHIIPASRSNYNMTIFSIASVFNMDYLPQMDTSKTYYIRDLLPATKKIFKNQLVSMLEKEHYNIFNHSIFNLNDHPATTPVFDIWDTRNIYRQYNFLFKAFSEMGYHLPTRLRYFFRDDEFHVKAHQRDQLDSAIMQETIKTSLLPGDKPKFVYAHFSKPHSPYTFDSTGNPVIPWPIDNHLEWKDPYVQQLVYTNKMMEKLVDTLLSNAKRETVIIIQGDHGYRFFNEADNQKEFSTFNAVYFSDKDYTMFNDSMTSVNTFRIVFNKYLGKNYPMLDNKTYFLRFRIL